MPLTKKSTLSSSKESFLPNNLSFSYISFWHPFTILPSAILLRSHHHPFAIRSGFSTQAITGTVVCCLKIAGVGVAWLACGEYNFIFLSAQTAVRAAGLSLAGDGMFSCVCSLWTLRWKLKVNGKVYTPTRLKGLADSTLAAGVADKKKLSSWGMKSVIEIHAMVKMIIKII